MNGIAKQKNFNHSNNTQPDAMNWMRRNLKVNVITAIEEEEPESDEIAASKLKSLLFIRGKAHIKPIKEKPKEEEPRDDYEEKSNSENTSIGLDML